MSTRPADGWLIVKRDLYFRPECKGYTGIRDEAGRYSYEFAKGYEGEGVFLVHESDAPEFREAAFHDLVIKHLIKQRDEARAALRGSVVVPAEVTDDMRYATWKAQALHIGATELEAIQMANRRMTPEQRAMDQVAYQAMLAAAPSVTRQESGGAVE